MTIYDIAKEAGVSASSVSRVINNKAGVKEETRKKIKVLLEKHNYSPDEIARGLVNQSTKTIGILISDIRAIHHTDGAYYLERQMASIGYCSIIFNTGGNEKEKVFYIKMLAQRRVEGVILFGSSFQTDTVKEAIKKELSNVPIVIINGYLDLPNVYGVLSDERRGVEKCVQLFAEKNRRKIAYVNSLPTTPSNALKIEGFHRGAREFASIEEHWCYDCENSWQGGYSVTKQIIREHPDVEGVIYAIDLLAAGGIRALTEENISIPGRVAVIGIDNSIFSEICTPQLTSLDNKLLESSMMAAQHLIACLRDKTQTPIKQVLLPSELVERETT